MLLDNNQDLLPDAREKLTDYLLSLFKIGDKTALEAFSQGQRDIFEFIVFKDKPRGACLAPTGYGKTEAVACAVVICVVLLGEDFIIGSVKYGTSDIIMKAVIDHLFDSSLFYTQLELDGTTAFEDLKRERKKNHLNFKLGGSLQILSFHGSDTDNGLGIGKHAPNVILDESPLLTPMKYLQLVKITEGTGDYNKTFLFELGNALNRNHFLYNIKVNPRYKKIDISLEQAVAEGRLDMESVEEKRGMPLFNEFYLCKFPDENELDSKGYRLLVTTDTLSKKIVVEKLEPTGKPKLGIDVGGGGDFNVYVVRYLNEAWVESTNQSDDTMTNVSECVRICDKYGIDYEEVYIDDIGIGRGVADRLKELDHNVNAVSAGEKPTESDKYANIKAENYWETRLWLENGGVLVQNENWIQLTWIKYKTNSDKVIKIQPKDDLKKEHNGKSPDHVEALMLTFTKRIAPNVRFI